MSRDYAPSGGIDVRLSFDDGPAEDTEALLDVLARHAVTATFFLVGEQIADREGVLERLVCEGHELGNHSWDHPDLRMLPLRRVREQLTRTSDHIEAASGVRPSLFRPPFGYTSVAIEQVAASLGMSTMLWDVDTRDYTRPGPDAIAEAIATALPGSVVLLHDGPKGREGTVAALELWLAATIGSGQNAD